MGLFKMNQKITGKNDEKIVVDLHSLATDRRPLWIPDFWIIFQISAKNAITI